MNKVLLTGASGFIGSHCIASLSSLGYEIHAVSSKPQIDITQEVVWHQVNLLDHRRIPGLISSIKPTHMLHLAWLVMPGKYDSLDNFTWVQTSLELLRQFSENGGSRIVIAGSGYEYDWNYGYCSEFITPRVPTTIYGNCKNSLFELSNAYSNAVKLSSAWGRIFFLYGPREDPVRLVSSVIRSLLLGNPARCSHGKQIRDYLYVQDVADALVTLLNSEVQGPVNIGSSQPITLKEIVLKIGSKLQRSDLIQLGALPARSNDVPLVVADVGRLTREVGWQPKTDLDSGLEKTIIWWNEQIKSGADNQL